MSKATLALAAVRRAAYAEGTDDGYRLGFHDGLAVAELALAQADGVARTAAEAAEIIRAAVAGRRATEATGVGIIEETTP